METHREITKLHIQRRIKVPSHLRSMFDASSDSFITSASVTSSSLADSDSDQSPASTSSASCDPAASSSPSSSEDPSYPSPFQHIPIGPIPTGEAPHILLPQHVAGGLKLQLKKDLELKKKPRAERQLSRSYSIVLADTAEKDKDTDQSEGDGETDASMGDESNTDHVEEKAKVEKTGVSLKKVTKVTDYKTTLWYDTDVEPSGMPNESWVWRATPEDEHQR